MGDTLDVNISSTPPYVQYFEITRSAGDKIKLITGTNAAAGISIPNASDFLEDPKTSAYDEFYIPANSEKLLTVKEGAITGTYYYHVFMVAQTDFADQTGSSAPKIVIEE